MHALSARGAAGALLVLALASAARADDAAPPPAPVPLLPGAYVFDVTRPPFGATPDDDTDDTAAIQKAIDAAAAEAARAGQTHTAQQIVFLPPGVYRVSDTLAFAKNKEHRGHDRLVEALQWLYGAGMDRTVIRLRPARGGTVLGSAEAPKPVVQTADYRFDNKAGGNVNFQLWVTDLSIVVPADQPHAVGLSFGSANMGGVCRVAIRAEGDGGHTGLGLVQFNNGPGFVEDLRVRGFHTGVEISDNWGEPFVFRNLTIEHQQGGGVGVSVSDKLIAIENLTVRQCRPDASAILLHDGKGNNTFCGGAPLLTLLNATIENSAPGGAKAPAVEIRKGHAYLRNVAVRGYGSAFMRDHGKTRTFAEGRIAGEFISVHGKTIGEAANVAVTRGDAPPRSLHLPVEPTPEVPPEAWQTLERGDWTRMDHAALEAGNTALNTAWVVVDPSGGADDTALLQAALDSGARYVGLLNRESFRISRTLVINGTGTPRRVELLYGLMSEILVDAQLAGRQPPYEHVNDGTLFRIETGKASRLHIKGVRIQSQALPGTDFTVFRNLAAGTVVFEDVRAKVGPRHYRNAGASVGGAVFLENVEWAYNDAFPQTNIVFSGQTVWARNLNAEMNIVSRPVRLKDPRGGRRTFTRFATVPRTVNDGGTLWSFGQKVGEYNGPFYETRNGGRTELIGIFLNLATDLEQFPPTPKAAHLIVTGAASACSLVGQERPRGRKNVPHANTFARIETESGQQTVKATAFPTHLRYEGHDSFRDTDPERYVEQNIFRVFGLFRVGGGVEPVR